jgi:hypothetical protein
MFHARERLPLRLTADYLKCPHEVDLDVPFATPSNVSMTRKQMIADLKDVSKALGDKKLKLDKVIEALESEERAGTAGPSNVPAGGNVEGHGRNVTVPDSDESLGF